MSTRITTAAIHTSAVAEIMRQQALLSKTQNQIATGRRFSSPAEDPIATTRVLELERNAAELDQYGRNSDLLESRLNLGEQSLASIDNVLQRVRELAIQANSGAVDEVALGAIASELRARSKELLDVANRRDAGGEYLFAGYSTGTQPFVLTPGGVTYQGDEGERSLQIGPDQKIRDGFPGSRVFQMPEGNGTFVVRQGVHTGAGSIDSGQVVDRSAWVRDTYTIAFTAPDAWEVRDSTNAVVASGAYVTGGAIAFNGVSVTVSGAPATGDTFTLQPSGAESLFASLDTLAAAVATGAGGPGPRSALSSAVAAALTQIDHGLTRVADLRAEVGARLSAVDSAGADRSSLADELQTSAGKLRDIDYAEAISRMNQQMLSLQAAQAAYAKVAQLSLFDYL